LHVGHAYSALLAYDMAVEQGGDFLLRIEDIDQSRARAEWEAQIYDDLSWLGVTWHKPVMRQSDRLHVYRGILGQLWQAGQAFACVCSRRDVLDSASAPQEGTALPYGPDGIVYPGTCRTRPAFTTGPLPACSTLRLPMAHVIAAQSDAMFTFQETGAGPQGETGLIQFTKQHAIEAIGDIVLARRDMGTSYHLSVVLDDAAQGVTHVVRGQDLFEATKIHVILQKLLGLPTPIYHHHPLIRDETGKRLAKRDDARALSKYRAEGCSPADIRVMVAL